MLALTHNLELTAIIFKTNFPHTYKNFKHLNVYLTTGYFKKKKKKLPHIKSNFLKKFCRLHDPKLFFS